MKKDIFGKELEEGDYVYVISSFGDGSIGQITNDPKSSFEVMVRIEHFKSSPLVVGNSPVQSINTESIIKISKEDFDYRNTELKKTKIKKELKGENNIDWNNLASISGSIGPNIIGVKGGV